MYINEIENMKDGKKSIILQLETNLQKVRKQLEKKNEDNCSLKQQYESEHQTILSTFAKLRKIYKISKPFNSDHNSNYHIYYCISFIISVCISNILYIK